MLEDISFKNKSVDYIESADDIESVDDIESARTPSLKVYRDLGFFDETKVDE